MHLHTRQGYADCVVVVREHKGASVLIAVNDRLLYQVQMVFVLGMIKLQAHADFVTAVKKHTSGSVLIAVDDKLL